MPSDPRVASGFGRMGMEGDAADQVMHARFSATNGFVLVGLAHVEDPGELMYDDNVGQTTYGPGDREGLARLGSVPCH